MKQHGFSLLELSIVLVIIGLIAGGIVAGASMIRAAELRSVMTELSQYQTAVNTFRDKYLGLPGDLKNATAFWGAAHATPATCLTTAGTGTETCDGNGDGNINYAAGANQHAERYDFWKHLANADIITGTYTGVSGASSHSDHDPGINAPESKLNGTGFSATHTGSVSGIAFAFDGQYGNTITFGTCTSWDCIEPAISPQEMWNIDTKLDDGKPGLGKIITRADDGTASGHSDCVDGDNTQFATATYELDYDGVACGFYYRNAF